MQILTRDTHGSGKEASLTRSPARRATKAPAAPNGTGKNYLKMQTAQQIVNNPNISDGAARAQLEIKGTNKKAVAIDPANVKRPRDTAAVKKAYVVYNGHVTGVFKEWGGPGGAARSVHAYSGSSVKGFPALQEAQRNWDDYNEVKSQGAGLILDPFTGSP